MKSVLFFLLFLVVVRPGSACVGEAQITARVLKVAQSGSGCLVQTDPSAIRFFSENQMCPLDLADILNDGLKVGLREDGRCFYSPDDELSGVVVKDSDGHLFLEQ